MKCPNCHKDVDRPLPFCPSCGTPLDGSENHNQTTVNVNPNPGPQMPQPAKPAVNAKKQLLIILGAVVAIAIIIILVLNFDRWKPASNDSDAEVEEVTLTEEPAEVVSVEESGSGSLANLSEIGGALDFSELACSHYFTPEELAPLTSQQLRLLRNSIYARHGRYFKSEDLQRYFSQFDWYQPYREEIGQNDLSPTELHNVELIRSYE